ncbi:O-antigen translocase [Flavobacterium sp. RSP49]|uniref:oligosaccharide flippase family protein n=1 Tax=Flavobacterium sp. RSP49 TaxID=2497487 RepID=UPI000F81ACC2|nr:oligosaccharide flippase family protein [Flavobacterium sp. RSP49]RTZ00898.1 O-antigen translocase [Flavobacterium sp. RSP49]
MEKSYKSTFKNTVAFGGIQIITIFLNLIKGKFIAIYLGPVGIGVNNLLLTSVNLITTFNDFGLDLSAVRDLSEANETENQNKTNRTITIVEKLFFYTAIFGALFLAIFSSLLSEFTFGSSDYTFSYLLLSIFVFFTTLTKGQQTVMRGLRKINFIIKSGFYGTLAGVIVSIPFYYFLGVDGIVPTMIITALISFILSGYYYSKIPKIKIQISNKEVWREGKQMMKLGIMLIFSILIGILVRYLISVGIGKIGNIKDVGLYSAAMSISGQYVGFILASLGADYFPRLVAVSQNTKEVNRIVNEQTEIVLLLATPLLIIMIITSPILIKVLLTKEFYEIIDFIRFIALGSFFQLASYCMGYISFAKNDRKTYVIMEGLIGNFFNLVLSLILYYFYGLFGLAIGYLALYVIYFIIILNVTGKLYDFSIHKDSSQFFYVSFAFIFFVFLSFYLPNDYLAYGIALILFGLNAIYSYHHLNKRMDLEDLFIKLKSKFKR